MVAANYTFFRMCCYLNLPSLVWSFVNEVFNNLGIKVPATNKHRSHMNTGLVLTPCLQVCEGNKCLAVYSRQYGTWTPNVGIDNCTLEQLECREQADVHLQYYSKGYIN